MMTSAVRNRLSREAPGSGEDVVVSGEELEHPVHVPRQRVFAADLAHPWEVVDFLQRHKSAQVHEILSKRELVLGLFMEIIIIFLLIYPIIYGCE